MVNIFNCLATMAKLGDDGYELSKIFMSQLPIIGDRFESENDLFNTLMLTNEEIDYIETHISIM